MNTTTGSVADQDPWNPYHFPGSGSVSKFGWIRNPDPYQMTRTDPTKTMENSK